MGSMANAIAVLNAGSSSIKFSLFLVSNDELELEQRGQIEGIYTVPHFVAQDRADKRLAEKSWGDGVELGHEDVCAKVLESLRSFRGAD